jgi:hypothetical protein
MGFWKDKRLDQLSSSEWESLCDGCGKCCLHKLQDVDSENVYYTQVACRLLDLETCRCSDYAQRHRRVRDCVRLTAEDAQSLQWLPSTCAYRLVAAGRDLPDWHPLISGDHGSVRRAGHSVLGRAISERDIDIRDLESHIVVWPE